MHGELQVSLARCCDRRACLDIGVKCRPVSRNWPARGCGHLPMTPLFPIHEPLGGQVRPDLYLSAPYGFLVSSDDWIVRSGDRKDLAPTILKTYGISVGALGGAPPLDGFTLDAPLPMACIPEGEAYLDYPGAPACCSDLQLIGLDTRNGLNCIAPTGGEGNTSGYCTRCGNGNCDVPENSCNCPEDCQ